MIRTAEAVEVAEAVDPVALAVRRGLLAAHKTLPPWLFYDEAGSQLFEQITELPEYYLTRTERGLLTRHSDEILAEVMSAVTIVELGAGTASKTGILLRAAALSQPCVLYQPIDVSASALEEARTNLELTIRGVIVQPSIANYVTEAIRIERPQDHGILAMYIGSSIGNFSPLEAHAILANLRSQMEVGDGLLLGTDLAPGPHKTVDLLTAAYDDASGVTAAFNLNVLARLNRELDANFQLDDFRHRALWNQEQSRMEMHLESLIEQTVHVPANSSGQAFTVGLRAGETIHTENSYKFTDASISAMVEAAGFSVVKRFKDLEERFAVTLATIV